MRGRIAVSFILLSGAAFAPGAIAQEGQLAKVYACADIADATQRHACFDALVPELKASRAAEAATPQRQADAFGKPGASQSPLTAPVRTAEATGTAKAAEKEVDRLTLTVTSISTGSDGKFRFTMENGQVWKQLDTEQLRSLKPGPWTAEIRKAALGSYLLRINKGAAVRVERVN